MLSRERQERRLLRAQNQKWKTPPQRRKVPTEKRGVPPQWQLGERKEGLLDFREEGTPPERAHILGGKKGKETAHREIEKKKINTESGKKQARLMKEKSIPPEKLSPEKGRVAS